MLRNLLLSPKRMGWSLVLAFNIFPIHCGCFTIYWLCFTIYWLYIADPETTGSQIMVENLEGRWGLLKLRDIQIALSQIETSLQLCFLKYNFKTSRWVRIAKSSS